LTAPKLYIHNIDSKPGFLLIKGSNLVEKNTVLVYLTGSIRADDH
jgi:hypothetical protein